MTDLVDYSEEGNKQSLLVSLTCRDLSVANPLQPEKHPDGCSFWNDISYDNIPEGTGSVLGGSCDRLTTRPGNPL
jgi:hypothetical protein